MITSITPKSLQERSFQTIIKDYLIQNNNYTESYNTGYDTNYAIDTDQLFTFLETTQSKSMNRLKEIYKQNYRSKIITNLDRELATRGSIDVIKHGIKDYGVKLDIAYFRPPTNLNEDQYILYKQNLISVTAKLAYDGGKEIDIIIF